MVRTMELPTRHTLLMLLELAVNPQWGALPVIFESWGEWPFIFGELGSTGNYFQGAGEQALNFGDLRPLSESDFLVFVCVGGGGGGGVAAAVPRPFIHFSITTGTTPVNFLAKADLGWSFRFATACISGSIPATCWTLFLKHVRGACLSILGSWEKLYNV